MEAGAVSGGLEDLKANGTRMALFVGERSGTIAGASRWFIVAHGGSWWFIAVRDSSWWSMLRCITQGAGPMPEN